MTSEQRDALRQLAALLEGNDSESSTTTSFPIDCQVLRVNLVRGPLDEGFGGKRQGRWRNKRTFTRLVSQAFLETRRLS